MDVFQKAANRLHLCPFFIKGSCKFGLKCKRSHSYGDEHTVRVLNHFRLGFLNTPSSIFHSAKNYENNRGRKRNPSSCC